MEEIAKEYSNTLEILNKCDYLDPEQSNAKDALLSCSGKRDHKNPIEERYCLNSNRPLIEGFSMDNNNMLLGPGVGYTPNFECEVGVKETLMDLVVYKNLAVEKDIVIGRERS